MSKFKLTVVNKGLILGPNNCGKTKLGKGIIRIRNILLGVEECRDTKFECTFVIDGRELKLKLASNIECLYLDNKVVYNIKDNILEVLNIDSIKQIGVEKVIITKRKVKTPFLKQLSNENNKEDTILTRLFYFIVNMRYFSIDDLYIDFMNTDEIEKIIGRKFEVTTQGSKYINESEAERIKVVVTEILKEKYTFLYLDNMGTRLHYDYLAFLVENILKEKDKQVLIVTHNTYLISNNYFRPDSLYEGKKGVFKSFDSLTNRDLREEHNLLRLYVAGEFEEKYNHKESKNKQ